MICRWFINYILGLESSIPAEILINIEESQLAEFTKASIQSQVERLRMFTEVKLVTVWCDIKWYFYNLGLNFVNGKTLNLSLCIGKSKSQIKESTRGKFRGIWRGGRGYRRNKWRRRNQCSTPKSEYGHAIRWRGKYLA